MMQCRSGLNVEPADVKEWQYRQHMILRSQGMHVLTHHPIPEQCFLAQDRAFRPSGSARSVDDQKRTAQVGMRVAAIAIALVQQVAPCTPARGSEVETDDEDVGRPVCQRRQQCRKGLLNHYHLCIALHKMKSCSATERRQFKGTKIAPIRAQA
ncbi:hypothetical protein AJ88_38005 [Mesorhizobium amorphae CCBAU 01583]|nr:hypothetical protein AJ88_38005 [Mesorhizobium amorphae CCBAU 01583]